MPSYGIIGNPVKQSLSPVLHRMFYEATGYDGNYSHFLVMQNEVANVIPAMKTLGVSGINVTSPYKQAIMQYLDEISAEAAAIGAVNTVHIRGDGSAVGYNTDCHGFAQSLLREGIEIAGKSFAVCGPGGAGEAARWALDEYGAARVVTVSRDSAKGISYEELGKLEGMDAIINCTPLGMAPRLDESPVKPEVFEKFGSAVDMIYNPEETLFLKTARKAGLNTLNGLPMLVLQGARAFELWTGITPPPEKIDEILAKITCVLKKKAI